MGHSGVGANEMRDVLDIVECLERTTSLNEFAGAFLSSLEQRFGMDRSSLVVGTADQGVIQVTCGIDLDGWESYLSSFVVDHEKLRYVMKAFVRFPKMEVATLEDMIDSIGPLPSGSREILEHLEVASFMSMFIPLDVEASSSVNLISSTPMAFGGRERELLMLLRPHLQHHIKRCLGVQPTQDLLAPLSPREIDVALLIASGYTNQQIARKLELSESTVKKHVTSTLAKTGLPHRTALAVGLHFAQSEAPAA